jgi:hypothetical protein
MLRQDPNVMMVGEIRDAETARIAVQAGLSGHLILTTIHAESAAGVFNRLIEMGVDRSCWPAPRWPASPSGWCACSARAAAARARWTPRWPSGSRS